VSLETDTGEGPISIPPNERRSGEGEPVRGPSPLSWFLLLLGVALAVRWFPISFCARNAHYYFVGSLDDARAMLHGTGRDMLTLVEPQRFYGKNILPADRFGTGSSRFDGEWYFGTFMMSVVGTSQVALEYPELRPDTKDVLGLGVHTLMAPKTREYDTRAWGEDALTGSKDHCAFVCYWLYAINLARQVEPNIEGIQEADRVLLRLEAQLRKNGVLETYPGEYYPVDMAMFVGALEMHSRVTGADHAEALRAFESSARAHWLDSNGTLIQSVDANGKPRDMGRGRGSGTALASVALVRALPSLSLELWSALRAHNFRTVLGFGAVREYGTGTVAGGPADVDSGPIVFGLGISATGFALGAARAHGDEQAFRALYASAHFAGAPVDGDDRRNFVTGGPLGQGILFAMMTSPRATRVPSTPLAPSGAR
jgi:hypothetical protein